MLSQAVEVDLHDFYPPCSIWQPDLQLHLYRPFAPSAPRPRPVSPSPSLSLSLSPPLPPRHYALPSPSLQQRWWTTSNRPGRSKAGSMRARRFVRPMSNTLSIGSTPSMTDSSWATMESRTPVANIHFMCQRVTRPVSAPLGAGHAQLIAAKAAGTRHLWHR